MTEELRVSVLKTLSYFDLSNYPLTSEELFRFLWRPPKLSETTFQEQLKSELPTDVKTKFSYYFLVGRTETIDRRRYSLVISELKLRRAQRIAKIIRYVPFLRAIFVCNSVGQESAEPNSDIDLFIVTSPKRVWIVRFFTNLILRLLHLRNYGEHVKDRICLSFFVDEDHLGIEPYKIQTEDIYLAYWVCRLVPLYDQNGVAQRFSRENKWVREYLPNTENYNGNYLMAIRESKLGQKWQKFWEILWRGSYGDLIERQARELQMAMMKLSLKEKNNLPDKAVVINDGVIKLHENDRRKEYFTRWEKRWQMILNK